MIFGILFCGPSYNGREEGVPVVVLLSMGGKA